MNQRHAILIVVTAMLLSLTFTAAQAQNPGWNGPSFIPPELNKVLNQGIPVNINVGNVQKAVNALNGKSPAELLNVKIPSEIINGKLPAQILNGKSPAEVLNTKVPSELIKIPAIGGMDELKSAMDSYSRGDRSGATALFDRLVNQLSASGNKAKLTETLQQIGNYLSQNGDKAKALQYMSKAIDAGIINSDSKLLENILRDCEPLFIWQETESKADPGAPVSPQSTVNSSGALQLPVNSIRPSNTISIPKVPAVDIIKVIPIPKAPQSSGTQTSPASSSAQAPREKNTVAIPKCNEPAAAKAIEIPKCQDAGAARAIEIPSSGEKKNKAAVSVKGNTKPAVASAEKQKGQKKPAQLRYSDDGTLLIARSATKGDVLTCAGPPARNLLAYDNLFVKKEWSRYYLNPVPGGRYAPYAADMGLDIAADRGYPIFATMDGVVLYNSPAGHCRQRGPNDDQGAIRIRHSNGSDTFYAHLSGRNGSLKPGAKIRQGEWLGNVGTANSVAHLHLSIFYGYVNYENPFTTAKMLFNPWKAVAFAQ
jgi:murein DD-endopeptidase MepM/ murein hydrolase activator NlpD